MDIVERTKRRDEKLYHNPTICEGRGIALFDMGYGTICELRMWDSGRMAYTVKDIVGLKNQCRPYIDSATIAIITPSLELLLDNKYTFIPCQLCRWALEPAYTRLDGVNVLKCPLCEVEVLDEPIQG